MPNTALLDACRGRDLNKIRTLLVNKEYNPFLEESRKSLIVAVENGFEDVVALLLADERVVIDVAKGEQPALHMACQKNLPKIVRLLLAHAKIQVNEIWGDIDTPLTSAVFTPEILKMLVADPRIKINLVPALSHTALDLAVSYIQLDSAKILLADPRIDITLKTNDYTIIDKILSEKIFLPGDPKTKERKQALLEAFISSPHIRKAPEEVQKILHALPKTELTKILGPSQFLALIVFLCDGYLQVNPSDQAKTSQDARRFFGMVSHLPLELQMVMVNRWAGLTKDIVPQGPIEAGFQLVAKALAAEESQGRQVG